MVLLPLPDSPTRATASPLAIWNDTSRTAQTAVACANILLEENVLRRSRTSSSGAREDVGAATVMARRTQEKNTLFACRT